MNYLNIHQVLAIYEEVINQTGGAEGIRDVGLLESAIARPQGGFEREEFYPDVFSKTAALGHSIINNHPFVDGNKRTGYAAMRLFLNINGYDLKASFEKKYNFVMEIAQGMEEETIARWLKKHSRKIKLIL
jgi:death-on-curing protein